MAMIKVNDINMHYEIRGSGPNVLFIHGLGADLKNPISIFKTAVPEHFTVLAFDPRGLGETDKPPEPFGIADMAADAAGLASALGWNRYHLIGVSMGGMVAQELAIRFPERVDKLVLASTHTGVNSGAADVLGKMSRMTTLERLYTSDTRQDEAWAAANPEAVTRFEEESRAVMEAMTANPEAARAYQHQLAAAMAHDTLDRINLIKSRTLVISGRFDGSIPPEVARKMAEKIPSADFKLVDHGHGSWYFDPQVWDMVIEFLEA